MRSYCLPSFCGTADSPGGTSLSSPLSPGTLSSFAKTLRSLPPAPSSSSFSPPPLSLCFRLRCYPHRRERNRFCFSSPSSTSAVLLRRVLFDLFFFSFFSFFWWHQTMEAVGRKRRRGGPVGRAGAVVRRCQLRPLTDWPRRQRRRDRRLCGAGPPPCVPFILYLR